MSFPRGRGADANGFERAATPPPLNRPPQHRREEQQHGYGYDGVGSDGSPNSVAALPVGQVDTNDDGFFHQQQHRKQHSYCTPQKPGGRDDDGFHSGGRMSPPPIAAYRALSPREADAAFGNVDIMAAPTTDVDGRLPSSPYKEMEDGTMSTLPDDLNKSAGRQGGHNGGGGDGGDGDETGSLSYHSAQTEDRISDPTGFAIICFVMFLGDMARGVMFPTLWPLVQYLGGDTRAQGFAVASFSFGRILVSPLFGKWSDKYGYRKTLMGSCSVLLFGTIMYSQAELVGRAEYLILCQTLIGIGSGTLGVTRAFVADVTPTRNRTTYMAWLTAMQYAGFTVTPLIGSVFVRIFGEENQNAIQYGWWFVLDSFTAPSYFMSVMCIITLSLIATLLTNRAPSKASSSNKKKSKKRIEVEDLANQQLPIPLPCIEAAVLTVFDAAILGCMLLNVATKGTIGSFETLGIAIAQSKFQLTTSRAGFIVGCCGTVGCVALLSMGYVAMVLSDVAMITGGMAIMIVGILSLAVLEDGDDANNPTPVYVAAMFLVYAVGYPIGHTAVIGLFSKIVGRRPQGTLLGWFASAGSLSRMFFPIMSGFTVHHFGYGTLFVILILILSISMTFVTMSRKVLGTLSS